MNAFRPKRSRCGRADFCPATPVGTVSDSAAFVFPSRLKRSSPSRSLAFAGSGGQHRTWHGGFLSNNVEAGHVAQRSVRRLLIACLSKLKRSSPRRSRAFRERRSARNMACGFCFSVAFPDSGLASRSRPVGSDRLNGFPRPGCTLGSSRGFRASHVAQRSVWPCAHHVALPCPCFFRCVLRYST